MSDERDDEDKDENPIIEILTARNIEPEWIIPNMMIQGTLNIIAGEPGTGKSVMSYTIGLAVALGLPLFNGAFRNIDPKRVVYFDEENAAPERDEYLRRAFYGLMDICDRELDAKSIDLLLDNFWPFSEELSSDNWADRAGMIIEQVQPHLIIVDTATPAFNIKDENDNAEATKVIKQVRKLMRMTTPTASTLILRHAKMVTEKGGRRRMRGATAWYSACDQLVFQVKTRGRPRKDGLVLTRIEPDKPRAFGLRNTVFVTPKWVKTDEGYTGLRLDGSLEASRDHEAELDKEKDE